MTRHKVAFAIGVPSGVLAAAWLVEAFVVGRGFISTYLAPVAIVGIFVSAVLMRKRHSDSPSGSAPRVEK